MNKPQTELNIYSKEILALYRKMYWWGIPKDIVIFDLKTEGNVARKDKIIQIGAMRLEKAAFLQDGDIELFECNLKPNASELGVACDIEKDNSKIFVNTEEGLLENFFDFSFGSYIFTYDLVKNIKFLEETAKRINYPIENECLDLIESIHKLAKKYLVPEAIKDKSIESIAKIFGVKNSFSQSALDSSIVAFHAYVLLKQMEFEELNSNLIKLSIVMHGDDEVKKKEMLDQIFEGMYKN
jgi:DNA polymerase III alpha subunit (gram-positive type)